MVRKEVPWIVVLSGQFLWVKIDSGKYFNPRTFHVQSAEGLLHRFGIEVYLYMNCHSRGRYRPKFYSALKDFVKEAGRTDVWAADQKDDWEEARKVSWFDEMDQLSELRRDSIWVSANQSRFMSNR